jgi:uncharacterized protein
MHAIEQKYKTLKEIILKYDSLLVAFSGGVDSALLLKVAHDLLGQRSAGCTAVSSTLPRQEKEASRQVAVEIGAAHFFVEYDELAIPGYAENLENRCFLCKSELFIHLKKTALEKGFQTVAYGANHDDLKEYRPGIEAAREFQIAAPLLEASMTKEEIRQLSRKLGLSIWDKPAMACLSSRIPYGVEINPRRLAEVEKAESVLKGHGFIQCRVRHHDAIARIELSEDEMLRLFDKSLRQKVIADLKEIGFKFVTIDLEGYRPGSLSGRPGHR